MSDYNRLKEIIESAGGVSSRVVLTLLVQMREADNLGLKVSVSLGKQEK